MSLAVNLSGSIWYCELSRCLPEVPDAADAHIHAHTHTISTTNAKYHTLEPGSSDENILWHVSPSCVTQGQATAIATLDI